MKHRWLLYLFGIDLLVELIGLQVGTFDLHYISKPLLMILIGSWVLLEFFPNKKIKTLLSLAITFSLGGDIFLLFDKNGSYYFIFGLISFLIAHIFYILLFLHIKKLHQPQRKWNLWIIGTLLVYVAGLFFLLSPHLGDLKVPVVIYAVVLSGMLITAIHAFPLSNINGKWIMAGAFLFVVSDSLLAINKFYAPFAIASFSIMITYACAQLLIATGVTKFIGSADKP